MPDLLEGNSAQDGFKPIADPQALLDSIQTLDEDDAAALVDQVQEAIDEKDNANEVIGIIFKTIGTAVGLFA